MGIEKIATLGFYTSWNISRRFLFACNAGDYFSQQIQIVVLIMKKQRILVGLFVIFASLYFNCGAIFYTIELWPDGKIPYTISKNFSVYDKMFIEGCIGEWEKNTNIDFQYYYGNSESLYVLHIRKNKNENELSSSAVVGYCFESMIILGVLSRPVILHELGHVIGLLHEHQRPDRDKYIKVLYKNIEPSAYFCFEKRPADEFLYDYTKFPYDYYSIMHYYESSFSKNGKPAISAPDFVGHTGNTEISPIDILKVNEIYGKPKLKK